MKPYVEPKLELFPNGMEKCSWWDAYRLGLVKYAEYWHRSRGLPQNTAFPAIYLRYVRIKKIVYPWEAKKFIKLFIKKYRMNMPKDLWRAEEFGSCCFFDGMNYVVVDLYGSILAGKAPSKPPNNLDIHFLKRSSQMFKEVGIEVSKLNFNLKHTQYIG